MKKKKYTLNKIHCAGCTYKIEDSINRIKGVIDCNLNFITLDLIVLFNEEIINEEELLRKINRCIDNSKITNIIDLPLNKDDLNNEKENTLSLRKRIFYKK